MFNFFEFYSVLFQKSNISLQLLIYKQFLLAYVNIIRSIFRELTKWVKLAVKFLL